MSQSVSIMSVVRSCLIMGLALSMLAGIWTRPVVAAPAVPAETKQVFDEQIQPLFARHCQSCHSGEKPKGRFAVAKLNADFATSAHRQPWHAVLAQLEAGAMPPEEKPQPSEQESRLLRTWIAQQLTAGEAAERAASGRVVLRRLNRVEYENTIRDLLGIQVALRDQLPQDGAANGFDNAGAALHTSSFLMERYLEAADTALSHAISNKPKAPASATTRYSLTKSHPVTTTTEKVYRIEEDTLVCFCSSAWHQVGVSRFYPQEGGYYRFRLSVSAVQSPGKPVTFRIVSGGGRLNGKDGLVGYFDAREGEPQFIEFTRFMEPRTTIALLPYGLAGAQGVNKVGADAWEGPGLAVQYVDVEGPLNESWPPESHRRLLGDLERKNAPIYNFRERVEVVSSDPLVDAERILRNFARRAFRRTVSSDDVAPFVEIVKARLAADYTFEQALRAAFKGVLISPEFLFLREPPGKLDDFALASRLSYFLWSTMPDDELFTLAEQGQLSDKQVLREQVERMLKHAKAAAFTENFVGQWLALREIDATEPSHLLYPEFDHMLKVAMIRETELFFDELLKNDLSLANFVASDFSMLNGRLAKHYGVPNVDGWEFQKVSLPPETHRGGVLTMASVLKVTANGTTTSPVMRGAWVLDRILGTPPSPPPDDVPAIDPDIRGATTIREQLAKHRSVEACAVCHKQIDPPGFALESFDCIGGWRDEYRVTGAGRSVTVDGRRMSYHIGKPVDPSYEMPDGQKFANVDEFKQILLKDKDQLARALATKLLTYATGAMPTPVDRADVERVVAAVRGKNYGLRSLVHEVVQSEVFLKK